MAEQAADELLTYGRVITRNEYAAEIRRVSHDDVVAFAQKHFQPETCLQVTFGPRKR